MKDKKLPVTRYVSKYFPPCINKNNIDYEHYNLQYDIIQRDMEENGSWYEDGQNYDFKKAVSKDIALGRMQFYIQFADFLYEKYGKRFYLLDFLTRINNDYGSKGLLYYITTADEIHINLEGTTLFELWQATIGIGKLANTLKEISAKHTTAWEINQVFYRDLLKITTFHTGSKLLRIGVYFAFGGRVQFAKILSDNRFLMKEYSKSIKDVETI